MVVKVIIKLARYSKTKMVFSCGKCEKIVRDGQKLKIHMRRHVKKDGGEERKGNYSEDMLLLQRKDSSKVRSMPKVF